MKNKLLYVILSIAVILCAIGCGEDAESSEVSNSAQNDNKTETVSFDTSVSSDNVSGETTEKATDENVVSFSTDENQTTIAEEPEVILSNNIDDYTIEDIEVFIGNVVIETEYYYGPSLAFDIYTDISAGMEMGHPMPGQQAIVYGQCVETGWWRLDLGRSGSYPEVFVPEECIEK